MLEEFVFDLLIRQHQQAAHRDEITSRRIVIRQRDQDQRPQQPLRRFRPMLLAIIRVSDQSIGEHAGIFGAIRRFQIDFR